MPNDVAEARRFLAQHGLITVVVGTKPLPRFELSSLPPAIKAAVMKSGEPWANDLMAALVCYDALRAAQLHLTGDLEEGGRNG